MIILSALGFVLFIVLGYLYPKQMGWAVIFFVPLLGAGQFTLIPSTSLPLNVYRIAFAISLGMVLGSPGSMSSLKTALNSKVVRVLILFLLLYGISAMRDRFTNTIFTYIPNLAFPVIVASICVKTREDLDRLVKAMIFQGVLVSIFILIEYYGGFNISVLLKSTNPNIDRAGLWIGETAEGYRRSGYYRVSGIDGHPVYTGYRLAFLFPLLLWSVRLKRLRGMIWVGMASLSVLLLQTRTAIIAILFSIIFLFLLNNKRRAFPMIASFILVMLVALQIPFVKTFVSDFWYGSFEQVTQGTSNAFMAQRFYRIPYAFNRFFDSPLFGYGSKEYALYYVMPANDNDLPAPILYLLAGGLFVGATYLMFLMGMIMGAYRLAKQNLEEKEEGLYLMVALLGGGVVLFVNTAESHIISMILLYVGYYQYSMFKRKQLRGQEF